MLYVIVFAIIFILILLSYDDGMIEYYHSTVYLIQKLPDIKKEFGSGEYKIYSIQNPTPKVSLRIEYKNNNYMYDCSVNNTEISNINKIEIYHNKEKINEIFPKEKSSGIIDIQKYMLPDIEMIVYHNLSDEKMLGTFIKNKYFFIP